LPKEGIEMRIFAVLVAICALSHTAAAQADRCNSIADSNARLACYDKAAPPPAKPVAAAKVPDSKTDPTKYVDTIDAEDARMNAQLKNICRGC
jgi:hypothetical protein